VTADVRENARSAADLLGQSGFTVTPVYAAPDSAI